VLTNLGDFPPKMQIWAFCRPVRKRILKGILKVSYKRVVIVKNMKCLWPYHTVLPILKVSFRKYVYIFGDILTLLENYMCTVLGGFSDKTVLGIVILKSELFRGPLFRCTVCWQPPRG
jgi:hypothetical protein